MDDPIAITGMSCRFAGVSTPVGLWETVMAGRSMLALPGPDVELPIGRKSIFNCPYPARIAALDELYSCVPSLQNFPRQINAGENQDLYFATQLAFDALADAGVPRRKGGGMRGSVRLGYAPPFNSSTVNWLQHTEFLDQTMDIIRRFMSNASAEQLDGVRGQLVESLPAPNAGSFLLGTGYRFASWIARECGLAGVATTMDAGVLTGAVALADAAADLREGRADIALAGALTPPLNRAYLDGLSGEVPFSARGELYPFAESQEGTLPGEGGAFFVLKRRSDALKDRDRIYALLRNVEVGHAPAEDEAALFRRAADRAGIPVRSIGLIEADGSGIAEAEAREIRTVHQLWGEHKPGAPLVGMGSVKGNIGHTLRAAMAAGTVKAALAIYRRVLPPQRAPEKPAASLSTITSSAYLLTEPRPWITGDSANPRRAAVTGANFDTHTSSGPDAGRAAVILLEEELENRL